MLALEASDLSRGLEAVHHGHVAVHENHSVLTARPSALTRVPLSTLKVLLYFLHCFLTVHGFVTLKGEGHFQDRLQGHYVEDIVIYYQDLNSNSTSTNSS